MSITQTLKSNLPVFVLKPILQLKQSRIRRKHYKYNVARTVNLPNGKALCACCGEEFNNFLDCWVMLDSVGSKRERYEKTYKNSVCPKCLSYPRHRICCHYLNEHKEELKGSNTLLFGAEYSIIKWLKRHKFFYQTADLFDFTSDYVIDIQDTKFSDDSWSIIVCNHVLEHVRDLNKALQELKRIIKEDGFVIVTSPTDYNYETTKEDTSDAMPLAQRVELFGQEDHFRIFGKDFPAILTNAGFKVEIVDGDTFPAMYGMQVGPGDYDDNKVYICRK